MKGSVKRAALRLRVKELRTELYRTLPSTAGRATKMLYGEITKRASEASVLSQPTLSSKPDGAESKKRCDPARFYVPGW